MDNIPLISVTIIALDLRTKYLSEISGTYKSAFWET